jgi:hypothetical protein
MEAEIEDESQRSAVGESLSSQSRKDDMTPIR